MCLSDIDLLHLERGERQCQELLRSLLNSSLWQEKRRKATFAPVSV